MIHVKTKELQLRFKRNFVSHNILLAIKFSDPVAQ